MKDKEKIYEPKVIRSSKKELGVIYDMTSDEFYHIVPQDGSATVGELLMFFQGAMRFLEMFEKMGSKTKDDKEAPPREFN